MIKREPTPHSAAAFEPRLDIVPPAQRRLWQELSDTPADFTLYGGTAIALRLGHRPSADFGFFASAPFVPNALLRRVPYLKGAALRQSAPNTLTVTVERSGAVEVSFFGGLGLGQVAPAQTAIGPRIKVASLLDLAGCKVAVVTQRAELKDYVDIHALLMKAHIPLAQMLAAATIIYGADFSPLLLSKRWPIMKMMRWTPTDVRQDPITAGAVDLIPAGTHGGPQGRGDHETASSQRDPDLAPASYGPIERLHPVRFLTYVMTYGRSRSSP